MRGGRRSAEWQATCLTADIRARATLPRGGNTMAATKNPAIKKAMKDLPPKKTVLGGKGTVLLQGHQCLVFFVG